LTGALADRDGGTTGMGLNQTVPVPLHGRVSEVGSGLGLSYLANTSVSPAAGTMNAAGGGAPKKTPIVESLPVSPSEPPVDDGGKSW
jgi:hypothetical protein